MRTVEIRTAALEGVRGVTSRVKVTLRRGGHNFSIVGCSADASTHLRARARSAIENSGYGWPAGDLTVAFEHPAAPHMDLAAALGVLEVSGQLGPTGLGALSTCGVLGELGFDGRLHKTRGAYPLGVAAGAGGYPVICPDMCAGHVALGAVALGGVDLAGIAAHMKGFTTLHRAEPIGPAPDNGDAPDMADVRACAAAIAALERAAISGRGLVLRGPPGAGKTMLARRLSTILPPMTREEVLEVAAVASVSGLLGACLPGRPFRAPHHSVSGVALIGGGVHGRLGEATLAHHGVLFLDELPEFGREALDALAYVLRRGEVVLGRGGKQVTLPARPLLVAALNPCPCGYRGHPRQLCNCSDTAVRAYEARWRGAQIADHFAEVVDLPAVAAVDLQKAPQSESSATIRARVVAARSKEG